MNPHITLELTFAKTDVVNVLRHLRMAQMHSGKPTRNEHEIKVLERALDHLDRADELASAGSRPSLPDILQMVSDIRDEAEAALSQPMVREDL